MPKQILLLNTHSSRFCPKTPSHRLQVALKHQVTVFITVPSCSAAQSCLTHCDPKDSSPPGSSVHGILKERILEQVATSFARGSSWPRIEPASLSPLAWAREFFTTAPPGKVKEKGKFSHFLPTSWEAFSHSSGNVPTAEDPAATRPLPCTPAPAVARPPAPSLLRSGLMVPPPLLRL